MNDFKKRILEEKNELELKLGKLSNFLKKNDDDGIDEAIVLLRLQEKIMHSYLIILDRRLRLEPRNFNQSSDIENMKND